ncbi:MAG: hypothetical protein LQ350_005749 [Teloschistes chrysophthalmus]|nr:MAG: hypothetical protein LQ350_005749 [Niorma chrysophthalma]
MESYASRHRPVRYRQPLSDTTHWVNNQSSPPPRSAPEPSRSSPPSSIPHHESLKPGGNLQIRNHPVPPVAAVVDKRISAISAQEKRNANRDSQTSNSTTNSAQSRRRKTHVGPWQLGKTIGKGASGRVRKARHALTGQEAAIKIVSKVVANKLRTTSLAHMETLLSNDKRGKRQIPFGIEREVCIMKLIEHPNVISLYDVWENRGELYLVLEYVEGGELFEHISTHRQLPEHEAVRIFRQIIAGLSYCHRFNICHRDLKPENILLDKNKNVKLADFGMAVVQPAETTLRTSCGSPHYAAPEVIRAENYRGDRADIWSCGVVLYAMLAGCLPFDSPGQWDEVIRTVLQGHYTFPKDMSAYAQDLIFRMLQMDPKNRIPIKKMWHHPLLQRYEHLDALDAKGKPYIGPLPPLTVKDCGPPMKTRDEIDEELLKNLRNLYHGLNEEELVGRLLSDEPNHERILYTKLLAYVEEQLEDYPGAIIEYSTSDYHHVPKHDKPPPMPKRSATRASLLGSRALPDRTPSRYSVSVHEKPRKSVSLQHPISASKQIPSSSADSQRNPSVAETQSSYDPYRASRARFNKPQSDHTRITVLRNLSTRNAGEIQSHSSLNLRVPNKASSQQPVPLPSPVDDVFSIVGSPPAANSSQLPRLRHERRMSRASSKHTFASTSGTRVVRKSVSYRRGVSFVHVRKRSASADIPLQSLRNSSSLAPEPVNPHRATSNPLPSVPASPQLPDSPTLPSTVVRSRKYVPVAGEDPAQNSRITSQIWKEDTRKVSKELENYCDEAFNRVSVASSVPTTTTAATERKSLGTPATTYSVYDNVPMPSGAARRAAKLSEIRDYENRPLPKTPVEEAELGSLTQRELAKTRDILIKRAADRDMPPGSLDEVIAHLDRLMQPSAVRLQEEERRAISSPDPGLAPNKDTFERFLEGRNVAYRSASEPTPGSPRKRRRHGDTIRIVDDRDEQRISPIKPLTIRKQSNSSTPSTETLRQRAAQDQLLQVPQFPQRSDSRPHDWAHFGERRSAGLSLLENSLEPIEEHVDDRAYDEPKRSVTKKKSWFFRGHKTNQSQESDKMPPPPSPRKQIQKGFQNLGGRKEVPAWKRASDPSSETSHNGGDKKEGTSGKAKLLKFFGKSGLKTKHSGTELRSDYDLEDDASFVSSSTTSHQRPYLMSGALQNKSTASVSRHRDKKNAYHDHKIINNKSALSMPGPVAPREIHPQHQNWLMKFLRIKPAVTIMPFQVNRVRARKELVTLLREWRRYGMKDIVVDKAAGRVWARVGVNNSLHIRPVSLAIDTFTVLERGRKANLSLARFTQEKGAKSSFERVVKTMEKVLAKRGLLMENVERGHQMARVLG